MRASTRKYIAADADKLSKLFAELGYPCSTEKITTRLEQLIVHPDYYLLVLENDHQIIGFCGMCKMMFFEHEGYYMRILAFVIDSDYRKHGYGSKLLRDAENFALMQGCNIITLNSGNREERNIAHQFYQSNGYNIKSSGFIKEI
ncbi:GNAT family N-acetyltransferase [Macrococcus brunensis]|uniref:GNAT family N-acetyltransferase n=1 Tax=Macrococcus brunensis TaxID=198483 RepID=UPI001EEFC6BA|nr:GNAT family N-acetyltransferase [Macrococcus brunensis]ULG74543.1 GNAT family N-acetyltransferase [Macrococcus brunensis]